MPSLHYVPIEQPSHGSTRTILGTCLDTTGTDISPSWGHLPPMATMVSEWVLRTTPLMRTSFIAAAIGLHTIGVAKIVSTNR